MSTDDDIALPNGVRPTIDRNFVVATIAAPSGLRASDDAAATEAEGEATEAATAE